MERTHGNESHAACLVSEYALCKAPFIQADIMPEWRRTENQNPELHR
jgi:hypothetical protein